MKNELNEKDITATEHCLFILQQQDFFINVDSAIYSNSSYMANVAIYGYVDDDFSILLSTATTPLNDDNFRYAARAIQCNQDNVNYDQPAEYVVAYCFIFLV